MLSSSSNLRRGRLLQLMLLSVVLWSAGGLSACSNAASKTTDGKEKKAARLSKTVFAEKLGAYLIYSPLKAGKPGDFALHLTDLGEGTPVAKAEVTLNVRSKGNQAATTFKAQASEEAGIYTAQVTLPKAGEYYIEVQINHPQFRGRLTMTDFDVE